jgi:glutamate racemase
MKSSKARPIGIFDSGVGGLTVVRSVRKYLPSEDIIYFGDTARVPYGNKSRSTIIRFSREIMSFMIKKRVKMVVVACNTASSLSLASLKREYRIPVVAFAFQGIKG